MGFGAWGLGLTEFRVEVGQRSSQKGDICASACTDMPCTDECG